jgi:hypothetical protein
MSQNARADEALSEALYGPMQEAVHKANTAIEDGRDLACAVRDGVAPEIVQVLADRWLKRYGDRPSRGSS